MFFNQNNICIIWFFMTKRRVLIFLTIFLIVGSFFGRFFFEEGASASNHPVIISQIMIGQNGAANNEFIELYNTTGQDVDLSGFSLRKKTQSGAESALVSSAKFSGTIPAYGFFLIAHANYQAAISADLPYSSASYFISANNSVLLYNSSGLLLDAVGYGGAIFFETQAASEPAAGQSISRKIYNSTMQDSDNNANDFELILSPFPRNSLNSRLSPIAAGEEYSNDTNNSEPIETRVPDNQASSAIVQFPTATRFTPGQILINEFVSDPADGETEWLELCNATNQKIDLSGWIIEEGGGAKTKINGFIESNQQRYLVLEKISGNLNNSGDLIILRDPAGNIIDQVSYGNWQDGNFSDNAPSVSDPASVARIYDCRGSFNNALDFSATIKPTKGGANIILADQEEDQMEKIEAYDYNNNVYLSELLPNPETPDSEGEFIELYNNSDKAVNLHGWKISDLSGAKIFLEKAATSTVLSPWSFLAIFRPQSKIALNNGSETVNLFRPAEDRPFRSVKYEKTEEGESYNLDLECIKSGQANCLWRWSKTVTPGEANIFSTSNRPPVAYFSCPESTLVGQPVLFDSEDSIDLDEDKLSFAWDFGDGSKNVLDNPEHTYFKAGTYKIKLVVSDGKSEARKEKSIVVLADKNFAPTSKTMQQNSASVPSLLFNEILPNPIGSDAELEWIELKNHDNIEISLAGWKIEAVDSGKKYIFPQNLKLNRGGYFLLERGASKLTLNNDRGAFRLYSDLDELADELAYGKVIEGESYARGENGKWFWTTKITPGEDNIIQVASSQGSKTAQPQVKGVRLDPAIDLDYFSLTEIKEKEIGEKIATRGLVAVEPGILGAQFFYLVSSPDEATSSVGIQIYNYKKEFPQLKVGDYLEVSGVIAQSGGELRIKTANKENMRMIEHRAEPIPQKFACDELDDDNLGQLIVLAGTITDKKSSTIYLDDGSDEVLVYLKKTAGINTKSIREGDSYSIAGIVSRTASGIRLLPRSNQDFVLLENEEPELGLIKTTVLGELPATTTWLLEGRNKQREELKYWLVLVFTCLVLVAVWLVRNNRSKKAV